MSEIKKALDIFKRHEEIDYYDPKQQEKLYWELRDLGKVVDYIEEDNGRWTNIEGVVVKFEDNNEALYLKLVREVGKTEIQSDGDYYFCKVKPKEIIVVEWIDGN